MRHTYRNLLNVPVYLRFNWWIYFYFGPIKATRTSLRGIAGMVNVGVSVQEEPLVAPQSSIRPMGIVGKTNASKRMSVMDMAIGVVVQVIKM